MYDEAIATISFDFVKSHFAFMYMSVFMYLLSTNMYTCMYLFVCRPMHTWSSETLESNPTFSRGRQQVTFQFAITSLLPVHQNEHQQICIYLCANVYTNIHMVIPTWVFIHHTQLLPPAKSLRLLWMRPHQVISGCTLSGIRPRSRFIITRKHPNSYHGNYERTKGTQSRFMWYRGQETDISFRYLLWKMRYWNIC